MSIVDKRTIDGAGLTDDKGIILLITDHLDWNEEYQHLVLLQEKMNAYITFLEEKQYEEGFWQGYYVQSMQLLTVLKELNLPEKDVEAIKEKLGLVEGVVLYENNNTTNL